MLAPVFDVAWPSPRAADAGYGTLAGPSGDLPVEAVQLRGTIVALGATIDLTVVFRNTGSAPVEATYVLPLPERAALSALQIRTRSRLVDAVLRERAHARAEYDAGLRRRGHVALLEQERPDVVTVAVGNIAPGERVEVRLTLHMPVAYVAGQRYLRFPLVLAPKGIGGMALPGEQVGAGTARDTDLVPDASRISPPLAPAGGRPVFDLSIELMIAPTFPIAEIGCTYPIDLEENSGGLHIVVRRGERADRDFVLRLRTADSAAVTTSLVTAPDAAGTHGAFALTILPPTTGDAAGPPRDIVVAVDNSSGMSGWRLLAARRIAARIVDSLAAADRFTVLTFGGAVRFPGGPEPVLVAAGERNRFTAIEHLVSVRAAGDARLSQMLTVATRLLDDPRRARVLLVIGALQTGDDERTVAGADLGDVTVHTVGVGAVVNGALLQQLASAGRGEFVAAESEEAIDTVLPQVRRLLGPPLLRGITLSAIGMQIAPDMLSPPRAPEVYAGAAVVILGRWRGDPAGTLAVSGVDGSGRRLEQRVTAMPRRDVAVSALWARAHLGDLYERYLTCPVDQAPALERTIVELSQQYSVLTRLTAFVATVNDAGQVAGPLERVIQLVEQPADWCPEPGLSDYAIEYARRATPTEPTAGPPAMPPPPLGQAPGAPPPAGTGDRKSRRGVLAGLGALVVAIGVAIGGVAVTSNDRGTDVNAGSAPTTSAQEAPDRTDSTENGEPSAHLTVELSTDGSGTAIDATASDLEPNTRVRLVVVDRGGRRDVVAEQTVADPETTWHTRTDVAASEIAKVVVEDESGTVLATVEF